MELKQKVIIIASSVIVVIALAATVLVYFMNNKTLPPPPDNAITENLFVTKLQQDIQKLKTVETMQSCGNLTNEIWYSLYEDKINGFLGADSAQNEAQFSRLNKQRIFAYTDRFIVLANNYFDKSDWNNNAYVNNCITWIKGTAVVERSTPNWNTLQGFENNISCYNGMQNCINDINSTIRRLYNYFPSSDISNIKEQKQNLASQSCRKNGNKANELNNAYNELENKSYNYLISEINRFWNNYINSSDEAKDKIKESVINKRDRKYNEIEKGVAQWNNIFDNNKELNKKLSDLTSNINSN